MGSLRVGHDWATSLSLLTFMYWKRKWQPPPVFLPGESQGWGSLAGCCLWGRTESDMTEWLSSSSSTRREVGQTSLLIWNCLGWPDTREPVASVVLQLWSNCQKGTFMILKFMLFSHSVVSDSVRPQRLQHTRLPCPSTSPWAGSNSCPLSWWCYLTISSSVVPFSSCLQSFPPSGSFPWVSSLHQVAKGLELQSFQWIFRIDFI